MNSFLSGFILSNETFELILHNITSKMQNYNDKITHNYIGEPDILSVFNSEVLNCYRYTSENMPTHQTLAATTGSYHFENSSRFVKIFKDRAI